MGVDASVDDPRRASTEAGCVCWRMTCEDGSVFSGCTGEPSAELSCTVEKHLLVLPTQVLAESSRDPSQARGDSLTPRGKELFAAAGGGAYAVERVTTQQGTVQERRLQSTTLCEYVLMTASAGSDWNHDNGVIWHLTGSHFSHVSGGAGLSGMYLYYLSPGWLIGSDVTSTSVVAYVQTTSPTPVGTAGWHIMMGAHGPRSTLQ